MNFSVIIPVYNVAPYLRECLDSVLAAAGTKPACEVEVGEWAVEIVCVDDGSTDGSGAILDAYAERDGRFRVIHQANAGVGAARNRGLEAAHGDWVVFLDADDALAPQTFACLAEGIALHPQEPLLRFGYVNCPDETLCVRDMPDLGWVRKDYSRTIPYDEFFAFFWEFAYRRDVLGDLRFKRYVRGEDRVFLMKVLCERIDSCAATATRLYFYRNRSGSAVNRRPSVQVLKDELSHRIDVMATIDASGKRMRYRKDAWLEWYCLRGYRRFTVGRHGCAKDRLMGGAYDDGEQRELRAWFYRELPRILRLKGISWRGVCDGLLYLVLRGRLGWRIGARLFWW